MQNREYKKIFMLIKTKDRIFSGESFLHIIDGELPGNSVLENSKNIILERGGYRGNDFAYGSSNVDAIGGKYSGRYSFGRTKGSKAEKSEFTGNAAFYNSENALILNAALESDSFFMDSRKGIVIADSIMGKDLFYNSEAVLAYAGKIGWINAPKSGYIVAESIDEIVSPGGAKIFAVEVGKGKEHAVLIQKKDLYRNVDYTDIDNAIAKIAMKYLGNVDYNIISKNGRNYWVKKKEREDIEEEKRMQNFSSEVMKYINKIPFFKNDNFDEHFNIYKMIKQKRAVSRLHNYVEKNKEYAGMELFGYDDAKTAEEIMKHVDMETIEKSAKARNMWIWTAIATTVFGLTLAKPLANCNGELMKSSIKTASEDVREKIKKNYPEAAAKSLKFLYGIEFPSNRDTALYKDVESFLNRNGMTLKNEYKIWLLSK